MPGFAFVIANKARLGECAGNAYSLSLDLYDQWQCFEANDGKWRFTSPTHTVYAFKTALEELILEGGVAARSRRYQESEARLRAGMAALGYEPLIHEDMQSPIITSFKYPDRRFDFQRFYTALKAAGFIIYPGKVSQAPTFRIGNIGEVTLVGIDRLLEAVAAYTEKRLGAVVAEPANSLSH